MAENHLMNLPASIVTDILARLPQKTVLLCRCVCRVWLHLLSQPEFVDLHLSKSPTCLIVTCMSYRPFYSASFSILEFEDQSCCQGVRYIARMNREIPSSSLTAAVTVIGSVDGLVCIREYAYIHHYGLIHVWNPITADFISIQTPGGEQKWELQLTCVTAYGFGISSGKYQVVRIFQEIKIDEERNMQQIQNSTCYVYTIGAGLWKNIGYAPYSYSREERGLFLNGNLHWLVYDQDNSELISCLDLKKELFQPFPTPPKLSQENLATLNVYKDCLSVCDVTSDLDIVIWVMKEYGFKNSWSKEVVTSVYLRLDRPNYRGVRIIKVFKDGHILLLWRGDHMFSYHPEGKTVQILSVKETLIGTSSNGNYGRYHPCIEAQDYVPSFVSLKNLGEGNVKIA